MFKKSHEFHHTFMHFPWWVRERFRKSHSLSHDRDAWRVKSWHELGNFRKFDDLSHGHDAWRVKPWHELANFRKYYGIDQRGVKLQHELANFKKSHGLYHNCDAWKVKSWHDSWPPFRPLKWLFWRLMVVEKRKNY